jgi:hypothetical protein
MEDGKGGYTLDYYPEEERKYRRELGRRVIGDFATSKEALAAVEAFLRAACATAKRGRTCIR